MSEFPYMPFYVGDYLADTAHLDTTDHGAYLLLLLHYWKHRQGPKNDEKLLRKVTKLSSHKWKNISPIILEFFEVREGRLYHARIEKELQNARYKSDQARDAAKTRWSGRNADASSEHMPPQCHSDSDSKALKPKTPLPQRAGEIENEEEKPVPKNSRVHGTNPRALGTNPRAISGKERADAERLAAIEAKIDREIYDAWAEANACTREESLEAIAAIKQTLRQQEDEVVI